jgi:hypothetical protein
LIKINKTEIKKVLSSPIEKQQLIGCTAVCKGSFNNKLAETNCG